VARGGSLGATFMEPNDEDSLATTKLKCLANIDTAMGGHVAEKLFIGERKITTGCSSDLKMATDIAYQAVMRYGMFGEDLGYMSSDTKELSEEMKSKIDLKVKEILKYSEARVEKLLLKKSKELRDLSKNLYWYDYMDAKEMEVIFKGGKVEKEKVRDWDKDEKPHSLVTF
jgi:ATP-dependent Zn protease